MNQENLRSEGKYCHRETCSIGCVENHPRGVGTELDHVGDISWQDLATIYKVVGSMSGESYKPSAIVAA